MRPFSLKEETIVIVPILQLVDRATNLKKCRANICNNIIIVHCHDFINFVVTIITIEHLQLLPSPSRTNPTECESCVAV